MKPVILSFTFDLEFVEWFGVVGLGSKVPILSVIPRAWIRTGKEEVAFFWVVDWRERMGLCQLPLYADPVNVPSQLCYTARAVTLDVIRFCPMKPCFQINSSNYNCKWDLSVSTPKITQTMLFKVTLVLISLEVGKEQKQA